MPESPIQLEGEVRAERTRRPHVADELSITGTEHVDQVGWDSLIMKFCEFFGDGRQLHPSRPATAWQNPSPATSH
ncbi:hypothetical protein ACFWF7_37210 [Nocardia sp. NPDC060256]|uniref:hypothetical protein n=1 Tax=unclassified Nocardia TaxID=2637762 RepID=UPI00365353CA